VSRETVQLELSGYAASRTAATAEIEVFERGARVRRALKGLATAWLVAAASILIPLAHFVLVPGFVAFGVYLFVHRLKTAVTAHRAAGVCPDCGFEQEFDLPARWRPPHRVICRGCRRTLVLSAEASLPT
jgi:hypothetical protein